MACRVPASAGANCVKRCSPRTRVRCFPLRSQASMDGTGSASASPTISTMNGPSSQSSLLPPLAQASIVQAQGELLYTADGRILIDLFTAHGTVWLGHRRPEVQQALMAQLDRVWITGGHPTPAVEAMRKAVNAFLPTGYTLSSLASTGMEANEQALRIARVATGRNDPCTLR
eukprot:Opistho-2@46225